MKVVETQMTLVALTIEEIQLIIDSLQHSHHEWEDPEVTALYSQFKRIGNLSEGVGN